MRRFTVARLSVARSLSAAAVAFACVIGCGSGEVESRGAISGIGFAEAFHGDTLQLEELVGDSIAEIQFVLELTSGNLLVVEDFRPRLHLYDPTGRLLSSGGTFGAGPGEFRIVRGAAESPEGGLYLVDTALPRISVVDSSDLSFKRTMPDLVPLLGPIHFLGSGMLVGGYSGRTGDRAYFIRGDQLVWSALPHPEDVFIQPYWSNFSSVLIAMAGDGFVASRSIRYPLVLIEADGSEDGRFGTPPPSFRRIPEVEPGHFPQGPRGPAYERFLDSFTVIGGMYRLTDDYLAVVHSTYEPHPLAGLGIKVDYAFDVYRMVDTTKIMEDVRLPPGAEVLAGGQHLYVLISKPPEPWKIFRASMRPAESESVAAGTFSR